MEIEIQLCMYGGRLINSSRRVGNREDIPLKGREDESTDIVNAFFKIQEVSFITFITLLNIYWYLSH